jgi:hypothetical protein
MTLQLILRRRGQTFGPRAEVYVMSWKDDRDTLIAQTMAFVQSVASRRESGPESAARLTLLPAAESLGSESVPAQTKPFAPARMAELPPAVAIPVLRHAPRPVAPSEMVNEIRARIAGFRAHQERFNREREEFFSTTLARLRATLNEATTRSDD